MIIIRCFEKIIIYFFLLLLLIYNLKIKIKQLLLGNNLF